MNSTGLRMWMCAVLAFREIRHHRGRSLLSVITIVLGIASLCTMAALVASIEQSGRKYLEKEGGLASFDIYQGALPPEQQHLQHLATPLSDGDIDRILAVCPAVKSVTATMHVYQPEVSRVGMKLEKAGWHFTTGILPSFTALHGTRIHSGRHISDVDVAAAQRVAVISWFMRTNLFAEAEDPLGARITINGAPYQVVGVMPKEENDWVTSRGILVPLTAMPPDRGNTDNLALNAWATSDAALPAATQQTINALLFAHNGLRNFGIHTRESQVEYMNTFTRMIRRILTGVAFISLMVAGINIMSVAVVSLNRRVRDIGVHKAVGATSSDVFVQLLAESLTLSCLGGALGLLASAGIVRLLTRMIATATDGNADLVLSVSPSIAALGLVVCVGIGVIAGLYPAIKAAHLDPVEALRAP